MRESALFMAEVVQTQPDDLQTYMNSTWTPAHSFQSTFNQMTVVPKKREHTVLGHHILFYMYC